MTCKSCESAHRMNNCVCRCQCHYPKGLSNAAYQRMYAENMRAHNDRVASHGYGSSYF